MDYTVLEAADLYNTCRRTRDEEGTAVVSLRVVVTEESTVDHPVNVGEQFYSLRGPNPSFRVCNLLRGSLDADEMAENGISLCRLFA